ncbi:MAG: nucleotidyltransferase family protein [Anaerolineaceae bacterium]
MIGAIVLAAGLSTRMGQPKMLMEWGGKKVIEQVVDVLLAAELKEIVVVTGELKLEMEKVLENRDAKIVFNPQYANGEMTGSLQVGLNEISAEVGAAMVVLGDQPFIKQDTVNSVINAYKLGKAAIIMPSVNNRRGHPWIIQRKLWQEVLDIKPPDTMREFFTKNQDQIGYVVIDDPSIIQDVDTPEDYQQFHPGSA